MLFRVPSLEQHAKQHHQTVVLLCVSVSINPTPVIPRSEATWESVFF